MAEEDEPPLTEVSDEATTALLEDDTTADPIDARTLAVSEAAIAEDSDAVTKEYADPSTDSPVPPAATTADASDADMATPMDATTADASDAMMLQPLRPAASMLAIDWTIDPRTLASMLTSELKDTAPEQPDSAQERTLLSTMLPRLHDTELLEEPSTMLSTEEDTLDQLEEFR